MYLWLDFAGAATLFSGAKMSIKRKSPKDFSTILLSSNPAGL
jgi:hypothetical protein